MADLMAETFEMRRKDILEDEMKVEVVLKAYPALRNYQELRREFERITGKSMDTFESHLDCLLKEYAKIQISKEYYACTSSYCKESLEILRDGKQDNNARLSAARIMIFCCAQSDNNWEDVVFKVFGEGEDITIGRLEPTVLVRGSPFGEKCARVFCEKHKIVGGVNFYEAILTCYFLYYIFNIDYPPVDGQAFKQFDNLLDRMKENNAEEVGTDAGVGSC